MLRPVITRDFHEDFVGFRRNVEYRFKRHLIPLVYRAVFFDDGLINFTGIS